MKLKYYSVFGTEEPTVKATQAKYKGKYSYQGGQVSERIQGTAEEQSFADLKLFVLAPKEKHVGSYLTEHTHGYIYTVVSSGIHGLCITQFLSDYPKSSSPVYPCASYYNCMKRVDLNAISNSACCF